MKLFLDNIKFRGKETLIFYSGVIIVAILSGASSHYLLSALSLVTTIREANPFLIGALPIIGLVTAYVFKHFNRGAERGNNVIIESTQSEINVPLRMGIFTFVFTILSHLFGASVGREGSSVQIGGVLANQVGRKMKLPTNKKALLVHAGISAGFSGIFGTPLAGTMFGMEVPYILRLNQAAFLPCLIAAYVSNATALLLGTTHQLQQMGTIPTLTFKFIAVLVIASFLFGLTALAFIRVIVSLKLLYNRLWKRYWLKAILSSVTVVVLILALHGESYEGLSLWLIQDAFNQTLDVQVSLLKFVLTTFSLSAGLQGGEVTPLFEIGATLGNAIAGLTSESTSFFAAIGMITVFGCATNSPVSTIFLGIELFGLDGIPYYAIAIILGNLVMGRNSLYPSQKVVRRRFFISPGDIGKKLSDL